MADLLSRLRPPRGARASCKKRLGRGIGSGLGKTCGHGEKGDTARGAAPRPGFEGGQMPLFRRVPKRGFVSPNGIKFNVVNLGALTRFAAGATVDPDVLRAARLVRRPGPVKILAQGKLDRALTVKAHAFSSAAQQAITAAGGTIERLGPQRAAPEPAKDAAKSAPKDAAKNAAPQGETKR
jgi:large subunit ribosomal protein L15